MAACNLPARHAAPKAQPKARCSQTWTGKTEPARPAAGPGAKSVTPARRQIIPASQPLPPQPSEIQRSLKRRSAGHPVQVNEIEKRSAKKLTLMELTEKTCKWPVGDPATEEFHV